MNGSGGGRGREVFVNKDVNINEKLCVEERAFEFLLTFAPPA